jgi:hypothetical protein
MIVINDFINTFISFSFLDAIVVPIFSLKFNVAIFKSVLLIPTGTFFIFFIYGDIKSKSTISGRDGI